MKSKVLIITTLLSVCTISLAQTADTLIVRQLEEEGVQFSRNNAVTLLRSGQEKFDDMFTAIRQARSSVHLEYFNFRNDSIAHLLFDLLAEKVKEGVEVRALFDGFGNDAGFSPAEEDGLALDGGLEIDGGYLPEDAGLLFFGAGIDPLLRFYITV